MLATEMFVMHRGRQQELQPPGMLYDLSSAAVSLMERPWTCQFCPVSCELPFSLPNP